MVLSTEWAQVEVVELSNDGNGLGFHLVGGRSTGVVVKHVVPGGAADRDGRLQPGDHLLQVGAVNVRGLSAEQVAGVVRAGGGGGGARLLVARRGVPGAACPPGTALVPTRLLHDADALHAHLLAAAAPPPAVPAAAPPPAVPTAEPAAPPGTPPDVELLAVRLHKNVYGLGITVAGYVCEREELCGIFVRSIIEGSSAERSAVRVNDRIVAVDGTSLLPLSNPQAVAVLRATGVEVELLLERHLRGPKFEHLRLAAFPADRAPSPEAAAPDLALFQPPGEPEVSTLTSEPSIREPPAPSDAAAIEVGDPPAEPASVIEPDLDSATTIDSAILETEGGGGGANSPPELDPDASNEEVSRWLDALLGESAAALGARWQVALGPAARVLVADVRRAADGLGLSVEGTAQVVRGRERHARHYVRGLRAGGAAGAGGARRGDELLQANATVLRGAPHAAAVAALRALPAAARLVLARGEPRVPPPAPDPHASPPAAERDVDLLSASSSSPQPPSPEPPSTAALPPLCSPEPTLTTSSSPPLSPVPTLTTSAPRPHSPESTLSPPTPPPHSPEFPLSTLTPPPRSPVFPLSTPTLPPHSPEPPVLTMTPPPPSLEPPSPTSTPPPPSPAPPLTTTPPLRCSSELQPPPRVLTPPPSPPRSPPGPPLAPDIPQVSLQFFSKAGEESPSPGESPPARSAPAPVRERASPPPQRVAGLALWYSEEELVELHKTAQGLGFSILDYQDPQHAGGTAIVVRGVVAGGAAAAAGRPRRGERVLSVNGASVRGASLAAAVAALKAAPPGTVRLGLARPRHDLPPSPT